jgi:NAD-specific glutamate dehydrogenase
MQFFKRLFNNVAATLRTALAHITPVRESVTQVASTVIQEVSIPIEAAAKEVLSWFSSWSQDDYLLFLGFVLLFNPQLLTLLTISISSAIALMILLATCLVKGLALAIAFNTLLNLVFGENNEAIA